MVRQAAARQRFSAARAQFATRRSRFQPILPPHSAQATSRWVIVSLSSTRSLPKAGQQLIAAFSRGLTAVDHSLCAAGPRDTPAAASLASTVGGPGHEPQNNRLTGATAWHTCRSACSYPSDSFSTSAPLKPWAIGAKLYLPPPAFLGAARALRGWRRPAFISL